MKKAIIITGCSAVGKTYAMRKVFNVQETYGCTKAIRQNKYVINGYQYLPELSMTKWDTENLIQSFFDNGNITILEQNSGFNKAGKYLTNHEIEYIHLVADKDTILNNIQLRGTSRSTQTKEEKVHFGIKLQNRTKLKQYKQMTQNEVINYVSKLINKE